MPYHDHLDSLIMYGFGAYGSRIIDHSLIYWFF